MILEKIARRCCKCALTKIPFEAPMWIPQILSSVVSVCLWSLGLEAITAITTTRVSWISPLTSFLPDKDRELKD